MTYSPTPRQQALLRFIIGYLEIHGYSPSMDEMAGALDRFKTTVFYQLKCLEERGQIRRLPNRARAIEVLHPVAIPRDPQGQPLFFVSIGAA